MLIPLSWLKEYVPIKMPFAELARRLSEVGLTVETWQENPPAGGGEIIFDPEVTPNRPDWLSVVGIAREIAAVTSERLNIPIPKVVLPTKIKDPLEIKIKDNPKICPRVTTVIIRNVQVKQSPAWLQKRITQIGLRPINNLVDITNYVLWELGNPLHVFDYDKIRGKTMITELSTGGEEFRSLDGISYSLPKNAIIIKDVGRVIDLPPIKGGENTAVSNSTKNVLLHAIVCDPVLTRRASQALGLRSDSSAVSERGVDPNGTVRTTLRALELILDLAGGETASGIIDLKENDFGDLKVELRHKRLEEVLGITLKAEKVRKYLESLELKVHEVRRGEDTVYEVTIPTFRADIKIEEDLIEEVGRIYGYNKFPKTLPVGSVPTAPVAYAKDYDFEYGVKQTLKGAGYSEIYSYSLTSERQLISLGIDPQKALRVDNPISRDYEYLRQRLLANLIDALKLNLPNFEGIKIFELGKEYHGATVDKAAEPYSITAILSGEKFYEAKGTVELLLDQLGVGAEITPPLEKDPTNWLHPGRNAVIRGNTNYLGFVGQLHPALLSRFAVKSAATAWVIKYDLLEKLAKPDRKYRPVAKYPPVIEDLALIIPVRVLVGDVVTLIKNSSSLVSSVNLIDIHNNTKTFRVTYLDPDRNLSDAEVGKIRNKIVIKLKGLGVKWESS